MSDQVDPAVSDATEQSAQPVVQPPSLTQAVIQAMREGEVEVQEVEQPEEVTPQSTPVPKAPAEGVDAPLTTIAGPKVEPEKPLEEQPDKWTPSVAKRVAEEKDKRVRATARAEEAERKILEQESKITDLTSQLVSATRPIVRDDPLSDVHDMASLQKAKEEFERLLAFAERNRNGAYDVITGRNPDGSPKREDLDERAITEMKLDADAALRTLIPQREKYLAERSRMNAVAEQIYPPLSDKQSQWSMETDAILKQFPALERVPDIKVWIGHALYRRDEVVRALRDTGGGNANGDAERIVQNAKVAPAPSVPVDRGFSPRRDADVETARKRMKSERTDDAMEDFIGASLERSRRQRMGAGPLR